MRAHLYLRASTKDQDAHRAEAQLDTFAHDKGLTVVDKYLENISGTHLERPELMRLLDAAESGDVLLVEAVDRLSRLSLADWAKLKRMIEDKGLRLVVVDLPTSHESMADGLTGSILGIINGMLVDLMATMARQDQEKRVERIKQGLERKRAADPEWKPAGRTRNKDTHAAVIKHLSNGTLSMEEVAKVAGCGVATVYRIKREMSEATNA